RPVKFVGPGLGDHVHDRAGSIGVLGAEVAALDAELLDRVRVGESAAVVAIGAGVVTAVEQVVNAVLAAAVDGECNALTGGGQIGGLDQAGLAGGPPGPGA